MSSWFDKVTGSNDYERQSWRDSYNDGKAAGDWTGNVNARLDQERSDFQGATWSGSSSQLSAIELARAMALPQSQQTASTGPGVAHAATGNGGAIITGPGSAAVASGRTQGAGAPGSVGVGPRRSSGTTSFQIPIDAPSKVMPIYSGGKQVSVNRGYSNVEDIETRWGDVEFLSPSFFEAWNVRAADMWEGIVNGPVPDTPTASGLFPDVFETGRRIRNNFDGWVADMPNRVNGPMPKQEPVDWGR